MIPTAIPIATGDAHVLLIDDDPAMHAIVGSMLHPLGAVVTSARSGEAGIDHARAESTDVILLDHALSGTSGLDVLALLKADIHLADIPVIMQTGSEHQDTLAACFAAGALDHIRKPFSAEELRARVGAVIDRQRLTVELNTVARVDSLTGLANRAQLSVRLAAAVARARSSEGYRFTLMFLDFDRFKLINDSLGHDVGDQLLQAIAGRLRTNLRATDTLVRDGAGVTVARLGGDEFVAIVSGSNDPAVADTVANRLLEALSVPYLLGPHTVRSTASIGLVYSSPEYETAEIMLRAADIAMYEAKARGRGCFVAFSGGMLDAVRQRHETENDLRSALGTNQLYLVYQPIVSLDDRSVRGAEALARWRHPDRGEISPETFIRIAEETRLIFPLSEWILREACDEFMRWQRAGPHCAPEYISVNLSRVQLSDPHLVDRTMRVVREAGMRPPQLQLEVTESQIMEHREMALRLLADFSARGVRLAMDDFGTGYSSLSCLQEFPLDVLKVDRAFVAHTSRGRGYTALLHAMVTLADNLGLSVVAEGIEEQEQLVLLQALGCAFGQGYLISRALTGADFARFIGADVASIETPTLAARDVA